MSWSPDGRAIVYQASDPKTGNDLWILPLTGGGKPTPLLNTPFGEMHGQISPDGNWLAYRSDETGRPEVYVRPFPAGCSKWQVSTGGGNFPRWRRDGRELFYMNRNSGGKLVAVEVTSRGSKFEAGTPHELFDSGYVNLTSSGAYHPYAVAADGQRFLSPRPALNAIQETVSPIVVVLNWAVGLKK